MPKVAILPTTTGGLSQLDAFQQKNEIINFRFGRFDIGEQYPQWCMVLLYIPKPEIQQSIPLEEQFPAKEEKPQEPKKLPNAKKR